MIFQQEIVVNTEGRGTYNVTSDINHVVSESGVTAGICQVFIQHTSASIILSENADPTVRSDLESFMQRLVPDGDSIFEHVDEGSDDMPAHVRTILTQSDISLPVSQGRCNLGVWQGIYLWEHRFRGHRRRILITIYGE